MAKRKSRRRATDRSADVVDDLHDQAAWSSYTQDIPRLGDPRRDGLWWRRDHRFFSSGGARWAFGLAIAFVMLVAVAGWLIDLAVG